MTTLLVTHPACLDHDPGTWHPERPQRLEAVLAALDDAAFKPLERRKAPRAEDRHLMLAHPQRHVERVMGAVPPAGRHQHPDRGGLGALALRVGGVLDVATRVHPALLVEQSGTDREVRVRRMGVLARGAGGVDQPLHAQVVGAAHQRSFT